MLTDTQARFEQFIAGERDRYADEDNNRVAFSLGQVARYLRFITIAQARCHEVSKQIVTRVREKFAQSTPGTRRLTEQEMEAHRTDAAQQDLLHYDTESFFLFAKILLDKIAHFIEDYFGRVRSTSLRSHGKWCKGVDRYSIQMGIRIPTEMPDVMKRLESSVADYRDKQVTHLQNPRATHYTTFDFDGTTQIGITTLYPKESDNATTSPTVDSMSADISLYLNLLVSLIENNREKSRYQRLDRVSIQPTANSPTHEFVAHLSAAPSRRSE